MAQNFSSGAMSTSTSVPLKHIGLPWRLLVFSVFIFGFAVFVFLGLRFGYGNYLNAKSDEIDKDIKALGASVSSKEQDNLVRFYSQLANLERAFSEHRFSGNAFSFMERTTVSGVYYISAAFSAGDLTLSIQGRAPDLQTLTGQLKVFDESPELQSFYLERMGLEGGGASFGARLKFRESFFDKPE